MSPPGWAVALAVTLVLEVPLVVALYPGQRKRIGVASLLANCATNLTLNLLLWRLPFAAGNHIFLGEALALFTEAIVYGAVSRPHDWPRGLLASALANALSFFAGPLVAGWLLAFPM